MDKHSKSDTMLEKNVLDKFLQLNLDDVIDRLIYSEYWYDDDALAAANQYRRFLYLNYKYQGQYILPPSKDIDDVWHAHILYTKQYEKDSQALFGKFFHHNPESTKDILAVSEFTEHFKNTLRLYEAEFGEPIYVVKTPAFFRLWNKVRIACSNTITLRRNRVSARYNDKKTATV